MTLTLTAMRRFASTMAMWLLCILAATVSAQGQERAEMRFDANQWKQIRAVSNCTNCSDPIKDIFESVGQFGRDYIRDEVLDYAYTIISASERVAVGAGIAAGLLESTETAQPNQDMTRKPTMNPRSLTVDVTCYKDGKVVPCKEP